MYRKFPIIIGILVLVITVYAVGTAVAAQVSVVVQGNPLSLTPSADSQLVDVVLDGNDQLTTGALGMLEVKDPRGTGVGWHLDVSATNFEEISDPAKTISNAGFDVTAVNDVMIAGNGGVVANIGNLAAVFKLLDSASPNGRGRYQATPDLQLNVPAETFIGTYASTVTETLLSY